MLVSLQMRKKSFAEFTVTFRDLKIVYTFDFTVPPIPSTAHFPWEVAKKFYSPTTSKSVFEITQV